MVLGDFNAKAVALALVLLAVLLTMMTTTATTPSHAAHIRPTDNAVTFTTADYCPPGWTELTSDPYRGRVVMSPQNVASTGTTRGSPVVGNTGPLHSHGGVSVTFGSPGCNACTGGSGGISATTTFTSGGGTEGSTDGLAYVTLQLCKLTSGPDIFIGTGLIVFMDRGNQACPTSSGFSAWTAHAGRLWAFASSSVGDVAQTVSPTPAIADGDGIGFHSHQYFAYGVAASSMGYGTPCCNQYRCWLFFTCTCGVGSTCWQGAYNFYANSNTGASDLNIPYIYLVPCQATSPTPAPLYLPAPSLVFYSATPTCPSLFVESTSQPGNSMLAGRIPFNWYPGQATMLYTVGAPLSYALGSGEGAGLANHWHYISPYFYLPPRSCDGGTWSSGSTCLASGWFQARFGSGWSNNVNAPYVGYRVCQAQPPTRSPTAFPTRFPTTFCPTKSPTTSFPTRSPSRSPTWSKPSAKPTAKPSRSPTSSKPSKSPTTSTPSKAPTTSRPSFKPSQNPSWSPTPAPVWVNVCSPADQTVFVSYDNYIIQMGACAEACQVPFLQGAKTGRQCALSTKCTSLAVYTPLCKQCIIDQIVCQTNNCKSSCTWRYSDGCASCTNTNCRAQFQKCSGLQGAEVEAGGGTGGTNRPPPPPSNFPIGAVAGGVVGMLAALGAAFFAYKKYRERGVTVEMTDGFEQRIFGGNKATPVVEMMESENPAYENPGYAPASRRLGGPNGLAPGGVMGKRFRTRYSFHGDEGDELDVRAGVDLVGMDRNDAWLIAHDEATGRVGVIPLSYVVEV